MAWILWKTFSDGKLYTVNFSDTQTCSLPCSRFLHSFFRLKARASRNSSIRTLPTASQEAPESEILLEKGKGALCLDGAAQAQTDLFVCDNGGFSPCAFLPKSLVQYDLLWPVYFPGAAALCPAGTTGAVFTAIPGAGNQLPIFPFTALPAQRQPVKQSSSGV